MIIYNVCPAIYAAIYKYTVYVDLANPHWNVLHPPPHFYLFVKLIKPIKVKQQSLFDKQSYVIGK